jgi:hypothetical protein
LNTDDVVSGDAGSDVMNFTVYVADTTSTAEVQEIETVNVDVKSFAAITDLDMTNFDDVKYLNISSSSAYTDTVTVKEAGDAAYTFNGIKTATLLNYDGGLLRTGTLDTLTLTGVSTLFRTRSLIFS